MSQQNSADIRMQKDVRRFRYHNTPVLTATAVYPFVWLPSGGSARIRINRTIQDQVRAFRKQVSADLYPAAVQEYRDAQANQFPFRPYEAILQYTVTANYDCLLSAYRDLYEYTGGAHGNTVRFADTWSLQTGRRLPLSAYFPPGTDYSRLFLDRILRQADQNHGDYFENYRELILQNFDPENYFLSPDGFNIFYQQYAIAPYSTGIVVFTIPYGEIGWFPHCSAFR